MGTKSVLLKRPNFGQNKRENGGVRETVCGLGVGTLDLGAPFLNYNITSKASQRFPFQVIIFPLV